MMARTKASSDDDYVNGIIRRWLGRWHHPTIAGTMASSDDGHHPMMTRMKASSDDDYVYVNGIIR